jgi:hypothetical protein
MIRQIKDLYGVLRQSLWMAIAVHYQKKALKALDNKQLRTFIMFNDKVMRAHERVCPGAYYSKKYLPEYLKERISK